MKSEKLDLLAKALSDAQASMPVIPMTATNPFLKNKYADLATMIKVATPVLSKNGLSISQQPVSHDGLIGVTTTLLHTSGQWIEDTITLPLGDERGKSLAQVAGSIITYLRRYSYGAIVGLATDEDTDGNQASKHHEQPETPYQAAPQEDAPKMSLDMANSETNSKGVKYGDIETNTLSFILTALSKKERTDEVARKITAIQTILKSRAGSGA